MRAESGAANIQIWVWCWLVSRFLSGPTCACPHGLWVGSTRIVDATMEIHTADPCGPVLEHINLSYETSEVILQRQHPLLSALTHSSCDVTSARVFGFFQGGAADVIRAAALKRLHGLSVPDRKWSWHRGRPRRPAAEPNQNLSTGETGCCGFWSVRSHWHQWKWSDFTV